MECPFCKKQMVAGNIYAAESKATYWLPEGRELQKSIVTNNNVKNSGGLVLEKTRKIGFFAKERPTSYFCDRCNILITRLIDEG